MDLKTLTRKALDNHGLVSMPTGEGKKNEIMHIQCLSWVKTI